MSERALGELRQGDVVAGLTARGGEWAVLSVYNGLPREGGKRPLRWIVARSESGKSRRIFELTDMTLRDAGPVPNMPGYADARRYRVVRE